MDMEKVIKGLEVCLKNIDQQDCPNDCPYLNDCSKYENRVVFQPLMRDALALLKEQEAIEPTNSYGTFRCGNCKNIVGYNDSHGRGYQNNFCSKCGRPVKWSLN